MTRRSEALNALSPEAFVEMNPEDAERWQLTAGEMMRVTSRRGEIVLKLTVDDATPPGAIFIPMHFREAAANVLTNPVVDPVGKIPEFKFCAVRVEKQLS
jgi:predicted molibdopterin-dependent oxidoreductase YjgC